MDFYAKVRLVSISLYALQCFLHNPCPIPNAFMPHLHYQKWLSNYEEYMGAKSSQQLIQVQSESVTTEDFMYKRCLNSFPKICIKCLNFPQNGQFPWKIHSLASTTKQFSSA